MRSRIAIIIALVPILSCCARRAPVTFAQNSHGAAIAVEHTISTGGQISYSRDGSPWRVIARGSDPAISPDGRFVAYTHYETHGTRHERYVRVVNLASGVLSPLVHHEGAEQEYAPIWHTDSIGFDFSIYIPNTGWTTASLTYPGLVYSRAPTPSGLPPGRTSSDGRFSLEMQHVAGDPSLAHDSSNALFLIDLASGAKSRVTPANFWVPGAPRWIPDSHEILIPGVWHSDYDAGSSECIYRVPVTSRNWSSAARSDWEAQALTEGWQVTCTRK